MVTYEGVVMAKELPLTWSPWRNWLARPTVNREVDSSILSGDARFFWAISMPS